SPSTTLFRSEGVLVALGVLCGTVGGLVKGHLTLALLGQGERELLQRRPRDRRGAAVIEDRHVSLGIGGHADPETVRLLRIIFQLGDDLGALKESANALDPGFGSFDQPRDTLPRAHGRSLPSLAAVFTPALRQCAQSHPPAIPAGIPRRPPSRGSRHPGQHPKAPAIPASIPRRPPSRPASRGTGPGATSARQGPVRRYDGGVPLRTE